MVAKEWYSPLLRFVGIGKKNYLKAGHAALVLIEKSRGDIEYHDFGRYITPEPNGRVRSAAHDRELAFSVKAKIVDGKIQNLDEILIFLANNPKLTHGEGKLVASVCDEVNYQEARNHINKLISRGSFRYAAFIRDACNCARFVTTTLIASVTNSAIKKKLNKSTKFTPSTVGNVVIANTGDQVYEVNGIEVKEFTSTVRKENLRCFLDKLPGHQPSFIGTTLPKEVEGLASTAKWLGGIASGAWYEFTSAKSLGNSEYRFRRISPYGNIDIDSVFTDESGEFNLNIEFEIKHDSNCAFCTVIQQQKTIILKYSRDFN
ncbi:MAG: hypothetical protein HRT68_01655 [Flavobacteriaceae bacterium]|nr:hypothetical protein [Flavobacteriaceae bacterium]